MNETLQHFQSICTHGFLFILLLTICSTKLSGQSKNSVLKFNIGTSITKPDKRVQFTRPNLSYHIIDGKPSIINEFHFSISSEFSLKQDIFFEAGLGSSIIFNNVKRVVDHHYFTGLMQLRLWLNHWYFNSSLQPHIGIKKQVLTKRNWNYFVGVNNSFSLSLHKIMFGLSKKGIHYRFSRFTFEPFANELFFTMGMQKENKNYFIDFRAFNMKFIDQALSNNGKYIDIYNPFKVRLRVAYNLTSK